MYMNARRILMGRMRLGIGLGDDVGVEEGGVGEVGDAKEEAVDGDAQRVEMDL